MKKRVASLYERRDILFLVPALQTEDGLWIEQGPCTTLPSESDPTEIGRAVLETLSHSGEIIPHPTEWMSVDEDSPVLQAAGIKRWNSFQKGARSIDIGLYGEKLTLTPTKNVGSEGFDHLSDDVLLPGTATATEVGQAVKQTLRLCE